MISRINARMRVFFGKKKRARPFNYDPPKLIIQSIPALGVPGSAGSRGGPGRAPRVVDTKHVTGDVARATFPPGVP